MQGGAYNISMQPTSVCNLHLCAMRASAVVVRSSASIPITLNKNIAVFSAAAGL